jgi:ubiquinone/menaquinone biosynthesis C-methylase UbiE
MEQPSPAELASQFYADTYDDSVPDWPGEMDFYRDMAAAATRDGQRILELGCGTGRVAFRLARSGAQVVGLDLSPRMLEVARRKSAGVEGIHWVQGDMRSFDLPGDFGLVIIPGHAFQNLNLAEDQASCLECARRHLTPAGRLVVHLDHQDLAWLGSLMGEKGGQFESAESFRSPASGNLVRAFRAWSLEPSTQTAIAQTRWEEVSPDGNVVGRWERAPVRLHCVFRFEMEHLLARVGLAVDAVYGDFHRHALEDRSSEMVWIAHRRPATA